MSLATELLFNNRKRQSAEGTEKPEGAGEDGLGRWADLNHVVYALIDKHEPSPDVDARLRADMKMMQLSGLISELHSGAPAKVYREASQVMGELLRLLPRTRC